MLLVHAQSDRMLTVSAATSKMVAAFLFGLTATDAATFLPASIILVFIAILASHFPARRAARVDPLVALRYE